MFISFSFEFDILLYVIEREKVIAGVVFVIEKVRFYRGKGGEIMWFVVFWLIEFIVKVWVCLFVKS